MGTTTLQTKPEKLSRSPAEPFLEMSRSASEDFSARDFFSTSLSLEELEGESLAGALKRVKTRYEKVLIQEALDRADGNKTKAAQLLKISRVNLHQKINEYDIEPVPQGSE